MNIVYPFAGVKNKEAFPAALAKHMKAPHLKKLEGFCAGPFMCGATLQSSDFHVFEMVDQHIIMCAETDDVEFEASAYPKLMALHASFKAEPKLASYFASDAYCKYAMNNPLYTHFSGSGFGEGPFGPTVSEEITP